MSEGKVGVGVVGYGYWGSKHVRVLSALTDVDVTVIDNRAERLAEAGRAFPAANLAISLDDTLDSLDALVIATPPSSHAPLATKAIEAGRHVLVEKPMATSVEVAQKLVAAADRADVRLMVGHTFEHNAAVWKLRELIQSEELGNVLYVDTARLNLGVYQSDVNVVWDLAPHDISILSFLLGCMPTSVCAWGGRHVGNRFEDVAYVRLDYPVDIKAYVHVSWLDPRKVRRVTVVGDQKMAVYNDTSDTDRIRVYDARVVPSDASEITSLHEMPVTYRYGDIISPYVAFREPLTVQDEHFINCIRTGATPSTDGRRGLEVVTVLEAIDRSLADGLPVNVDLAEGETKPTTAVAT
jgi:predicted dehydrogenase